MDTPPDQQTPKTPEQHTERYVEEHLHDQVGRLLRKYKRHRRRKMRRRSKTRLRFENTWPTRILVLPDDASSRHDGCYEWGPPTPSRKRITCNIPRASNLQRLGFDPYSLTPLSLVLPAARPGWGGRDDGTHGVLGQWLTIPCYKTRSVSGAE